MLLQDYEDFYEMFNLEIVKQCGQHQQINFLLSTDVIWPPNVAKPKC